ncbi:MAG TPA: hypothetical protein VMV98_08630 [Acidobacteriaceae bacterium]|nr:hypothetical protein [Acidobacteriaceae bacterium]
MESKIKAKRYSKDVYRLMRGTEIVGFAMALCNGLWAMNDINDRRISTTHYASPREVAQAFANSAAVIEKATKEAGC